MRHLIAALLATATLAPPASAQDALTDRLVDALASVPQGAMPYGDVSTNVEFGDPQAALALMRARRDAGLVEPDEPWVATLRGLPIGFAQSVVAANGDTIREVIGITPADAETVLEVSMPPARFTVVHLGTPQVQAMAAHLAALPDHTREGRAGVDVIWAGADDASIYTLLPDYRNPFGGDLGWSQRFAILSERVHWSNTWPRLEATLAGGPTLAEDPWFSALAPAIAAAAPTDAFLSTAFAYTTDADDTPFDDFAVVGSAPIVGAAVVADVSTVSEDVAVLAIALRAGIDGETALSFLETQLRTGTSEYRGRQFSEMFEGIEAMLVDGTTPVITLTHRAVPNGTPLYHNTVSTQFLDLLATGGLGQLLPR